MKNYDRGELAKEIIKGIALGGFIVMCFAMPNIAQVVDIFKPRNARDRYKVKRVVEKLQRQKLVNIYQKGGREVVEITSAGRKRLLQYNLDDITLKIPKKWDGWWRIVMFDIPESKRQGRMAVSRKIKEFGMYPIQKSVFVSPYVCKNEIDFIGEVFGVRKNIIYIKAREIEGVRKLKEHFNLS